MTPHENPSGRRKPPAHEGTYVRLLYAIIVALGVAVLYVLSERAFSWFTGGA